ncbi:hypothetical protein BTVI_64377 [Pitangus sulphuratus]|nr:hypothetical protein BTVI_64377 [Pitangus sulphuratus]
MRNNGLLNTPTKAQTLIQLALVTLLFYQGEVPQGSVLGSVLFNIFINDSDAGLEGILSRFADDIKLGGPIDFLKGREALQRDLNKLESWAIMNHMKFKKQVSDSASEACATERDQEVLADGKLNMSQQFPGSQEGQPPGNGG